MRVRLVRADVECFRSLVAKRLGLHFEDGKLDFLEDVVNRRMKATGCDPISTYHQHFLASDDETRAVAEQLTVGETYFFRYAEHFRAFQEVVIPDRIRARASDRQLRILSAGCASGEEAYSLAILIRDQIPDLAGWEITIQGVDINPSVVKKALRAHYAEWSLRDTASDLRARYFHNQGREFALDSTVKSMVLFQERNLADEDPMFWRPDAFDVVFCRNVTMYFTLEAAGSLITRIAKALTPGGFLFLGHAETLRGISPGFHLRHTHETFYYQLRDDQEVSCQMAFPGAATSLFPRHIPAPVEADDTWPANIHRASERIANLINGKARVSAGTCESRTQTSNRAPLPAAIWDRAAAMELLRQEKFHEAIEVLRELSPGMQADPDAQLLLAVLLTNRGELVDAEKVCLLLLARDELNAGAHYVMALCREHAGDREGAIEHDQAAIYLDSDFAMPHLHLGLLAKRSPERQTAAWELSQALSLLLREDVSKILLFGGGFTREALCELCRAELRACGGVL